MSLDEAAQLAANGVMNGCLYGLLGVSFALILGVTGRFHFAFALVFTLTAYSASLLGALLPYPLAMFAALLLAAALGALIERAVYRPIADNAGELGLLSVFVASLGLTIAGENLIRIVWGSESRNLAGPSSEGLNLAGLRLPSLDLGAALAAVLLAATLSAVLRSTRPGRVVRAVRSNPALADVIRISTPRVFMGVFAAGSLLAGVVALVYGLKFAVAPDMGARPVLFAFVVAFLGGPRSDPLVVLAAGVLLGLVESLSGLWLSAQWNALVVFATLFAYLTARSLDLPAVAARVRRSEAALRT